MVPSWKHKKETLSSTEKEDSTSQLLYKSTIPIRKYFLGQHVVPNEVCAVCLEAVETNTHLRLLPCGHGFHISCITRWLIRGSRCPLCNEQVRLSDNSAQGEAGDLIVSVGEQQNSNRQFLELGQQGSLGSREMYQEVILQSFERIRLRLYQRYLDRQRKHTTQMESYVETV
ncbi:hypothetical protein GpartN1_g2117.t1 [Galdieria partita]|uniref:RING-type domain-containing protein n=1 Tax=Galdieria partita TaxID=83374 RepID=A0A9C7PTR2_9RHOD|nr:hypothetical protein GpartN1_g2117.t1 [Galdieria partita]